MFVVLDWCSGTDRDTSPMKQALKIETLYLETNTSAASLIYAQSLYSPSFSEALRDILISHSTEHVQKVEKHASSVAVEISTLTYHYISLTGSAFERALLWRLSWVSLFKLLSLMAFGYRLRAISILGTEVMARRGLTGLALDTLANSIAEVKKIFLLLADEDQYPIVVHCTQGKDRTGLAIVLILLLLEVPVHAITTDYVASERELQREVEERIREMARIGLGKEFADCPRGFVEAIVQELDRKHGGVKRYLRDVVGIDEQVQLKLRDILLVKEVQGQ